MIDLHCHVLPGIDDGPADLPTAVEMVRAYEADGVQVIVATPHVRSDFPGVVPGDLEAHCLALATAAERPSLRIVPGGEVALSWAIEASDDELRAVSLDGRGSDLLVETPPNPLVPGAERALFELAVRGYRVTLAHPELSPAFRKHPDRLSALVGRGVLLQVTASALSRSPRRSRTAAFGQALVREGLCAVIASDAHSPGPWRPPELARAAAAAAALADPARAQWLVDDAPGAILAGEPLPPLPSASPTARGRAWLRRRAGV